MPPKKLPIKPKLLIKSITRSVKSVSSSPEWTNYFLIVAIVLLVVFSLMYIWNITQLKKNNETFENNQPKYEIVLIYSESCSHCIRFKKETFDNLDPSAVFPGKDVTKVMHKSNEAPLKFKDIDGVPAVFIVKDGKTQGLIVGYKNTADFIKSAQALLDKA